MNQTEDQAVLEEIENAQKAYDAYLRVADLRLTEILTQHLVEEDPPAVDVGEPFWIEITSDPLGLSFTQ
jgi:hypothetical protein